MSRNQTYSIELNESQYEFLKSMTEDYNLPDVSKTVRCLVNYCRDNTDKQEDVFNEIRCLDC